MKSWLLARSCHCRQPMCTEDSQKVGTWKQDYLCRCSFFSVFLLQDSHVPTVWPLLLPIDFYPSGTSCPQDRMITRSQATTTTQARMSCCKVNGTILYSVQPHSLFAPFRRSLYPTLLKVGRRNSPREDPT